LLVIRLSRQGRRNSPTYRLVVAENSKPIDGSFVEIVGNYNSIATDQPLVIEKERIEYWISKGATPSNTVARLLNRVGFDLPVEKRSGVPKKKAEAAKTANEAPKEAIPATREPEVATETPVVEEAVVESVPVEVVAEEALVVEEAPAEVVTEAPVETPAEVQDNTSTE
jgi:small subunit ribosomal protein S16